MRGSTALALALYQRLGRGDDNLVASPSGLASVLAIALRGARGRTADEIARVLHSTLEPGRLAVAMGTLDAGIGQRASASNKVDRSFVFLLRDLASGQVLFLGRVTDPRQL